LRSRAVSVEDTARFQLGEMADERAAFGIATAIASTTKHV
jgi:hypothetical protein